MVTEVGALGKHLVLVGFMGAGKTTIGREVARLTERPFLDTDEEIERRVGPIPRIFEERGEPDFRRLEEEVVAEALAHDDPAVIALGGGAVTSDVTCARLKRRAFVTYVTVGPVDAWGRVEGSNRPLAGDRETFYRLLEEREPRYLEVADTVVDDLEGVLLTALGAESWRGQLEDLSTRLPRDGSVAVVADEIVARLHEIDLDGRDVTVFPTPAGEAAKQVSVAERLWRSLRVGRDGVIVAFGGGSTTDLGGFVAATYARGVRWVAVPTTLVGQVDAAIGGKTALDVPGGKNLVGAFHFPTAVAIDPDLLATLPDAERRQGMAEVVKTGLLAGEPYWELPEDELVRACAAFKCAVVLSDPYERGRRALLNLGHTFGHALEAASDYRVRHGDAVALGLLAALRLSGHPTDVVGEVLAPEPVRVHRERAWAALKRDKKAEGGKTRLVLLEAPGKPVYGVELPDAEVRAALDALIVG